LWLVARNPRLSNRSRALLRDSSNSVLLSAVIVWEVAIKRASGKLRAPQDTVKKLQDLGALPLPITIDHAEAAGALPLHHRDPFDRMLVAQAQAEGATILSAYPALRAYDVRVEW
jgi:PIN domain nuclease of toxin-antitoxin system